MAGFLLAAWRRPSEPPLSLTPVYHTREKLAPSLPFLLTISIFDYILNVKITIFDIKQVRAVPRAKFQTLTEQMYYILLCLSRENCGMDVMDQIPAMTGGRVRVGPGTLYNLLEQFV